VHVSLLIDLLTLCALIHGLVYSATLGRRLLCLASIVYLLTISLHYYLLFAPWFGFFGHHRSMAAMGFTELLDFFGGFWTFFGVMVLDKGVSNIALAFILYNAFCWLTGSRAKPRQTRLNAPPNRDGP